MRTFLVLLVAVIVLVLVGWVSFTLTSNRASVNFETEEIEQDTERIIESSQELIDEAGDSLDRAVEDENELLEDESEVEVEVDGTDLQPVPSDAPSPLEQ